MQKVSPKMAAMFYDGSKFHEHFWKGSPKEQSCEIISKSDEWFQRRRILKDFSEVHPVTPPPPHGGHVFRRIKISLTVFEKGQQRNNPVKVFQNWTSGFKGEDF